MAATDICACVSNTKLGNEAGPALAAGHRTRTNLNGGSSLYHALPPKLATPLQKLDTAQWDSAKVASEC